MTIQDAPSARADTAGFGDDDRAALDQAIAQLKTGEKTWAATAVADRAALLRRVHTAVGKNAEEWVSTASRIKGLSPESEFVGEEWMSGPYAVLSSLAMLAGSLTAIADHKSPLAGLKFRSAPGDRVAVPVAPANAYDSLLLHGFKGEVWMPPHETAETIRAQAGLGALTPTHTNGVGLVLGAGNITSIPPLDLLYELVANNRVVLLKLNPVQAGMEDVYNKAFAPLVEANLLRVVQGGGEAGGYLAHHEGISHVHITGSAATHDVVVYGAGAEGRARKKAGTPLLKNPITSELGGVSPIIIVPGAWSKADLAFQAEHVATMRLHNGGYNCIAGQLVVLSSDWKQKDAFLDQLRAAIEKTPERQPWYPGSDDRVGSASESYPKAERIGSRLLVDIKADEDASTIATTEYFSPVLGVIEMPGTGKAFLDSAVATVNRDFLGTLGANVIADPKDIKAMGAGFREAIAELHYGSIAINAWTGVGFLTAGTSWGAFPGHTLDDVQSGIGVVHNAMLIANPERSVVTGPFRPFPRSLAGGEFSLFPKPPWFVTSRSAAATGKKLAHFAEKPSWLRVPAVFGAAFRA